MTQPERLAAPRRSPEGIEQVGGLLRLTQAALARSSLLDAEGDMKNSSRIAAGVAGAVGRLMSRPLCCFQLLDLGNRADPITSGLVALFVYSPIGAIAGLVLASWLVTRSGTMQATAVSRATA